MKAFKSIRRSVAISSLMLVPALEAVSRADPVVVNPSNMNGWAFLTTDENGNSPGYSGSITQMVTGPATPPLGTGSAQLATATNHGDAAAEIATANYDGTPLADLTSLSYSTYDTVNNGSQYPYIQLAVATTGSGPADDILFFEPPYQTGNSNIPDQGATVMDTWQNWNAYTGGWWDNNGVLNPGDGVGTLATYLETYPDATIEDNPFPGIGDGGISLTVGYASPEDDFNGYVDDVTIGTTSGTTTYDFEPNAVPEPASLSLIGLGAPLLLRRRRRA